MRRSLLRVAVVTVCALAIAGCGKKRRPRDSYDNSNPYPYGAAATGPAAAPVPQANWHGKWETSFGPMVMQVGNDGNIIGLYKYVNAGHEVVGALKGPPQGGTLKFKWAETEGGAGTGYGVFYMNGDGASFTGTWGTGNSDTSAGHWDGKLVSR